MAQQTQIDRVVSFYGSWIGKYPSFRSLGQASRGDILRLWSGLGYNSRAVRLHELARTIVSEFNGNLPETEEELRRLPGIGRYTASAIACFAFGADVAVVDVNVRRVFSRSLFVVRAQNELRPEEEIWTMAQQYLPRTKSGEWNQALMDLGARVCTARNPHCEQCPINSLCRSAFSKVLFATPPKKEKREPSFKGVPRRIYRGRILKAVHDKALTLHQIGKRVVSNFHHRDIFWLEGVVRRLERDSLVTIFGNGENKKVGVVP